MWTSLEYTLFPSPNTTPAPTGPITRARTKQIDQEVNLFLKELHVDFYKNRLLPNASTLLVIRFHEEALEVKKNRLLQLQEQRSQHEEQKPV